MIPYRNDISHSHQYHPIYIERQYPSCKLKVNQENEDMDKIPFIRHLVGIFKESVKPFDTNLINDESHGHIANQ